MTHSEIADHCLQPLTTHLAGNHAKKAALAECRERICQALADLRREHIDAQAAMLSDGTPRRNPKEQDHG